MPIKAIARHLGISKNTMKRALACDEQPRCSRPTRGSAVDAFKPTTREQMEAWQLMPTMVIAERIGWQRNHHAWHTEGRGWEVAHVDCA